MGVKIFRGDVQPVPQVDSVTVGGTYADGQQYVATTNTKTVSYTSVTGDTNITVAAALLAALGQSTIPPEFGELTYAADATNNLKINVTGPTDGTPFTLTSAATGTGTLVRASVTSPTGPNWWVAANFDTGTIPVGADDVYLQGGTSIKYGMAQSAVTLNSLNIPASYVGTIGLPRINKNGYFEYRARYLAISATTANIGYDQGPGSSQMRIDFGTNAVTLNIKKMAGSAEAGLPALIVQGTHASNLVNHYKGTFGYGIEAGTTGQFPTVNIGSAGQASNDANFLAGTLASSITTLTQTGGVAVVNCNVTTWTKTNGGTSTNQGAATIGTITQDGVGTHVFNSSGTITTGKFRGQGSILDCSQDDRAKAITTLTVTGGAVLNDPGKVITSLSYATDKASLAVSNLGDSPMTIARS